VRYFCLVAAFSFVFVPQLFPQQNPYFVTYDHRMEEQANLELSTQSTVGIPKRGFPGYLGQLFELEYGVTPRWSSALYLETAYQRRDSTVFTGFRIENRFKLLNGEHGINPVLYFEYERINEASRIRKEILGHAEPSNESLQELRRGTAHEIEAKLILSSDFKSWNIAENFMVEKNLTEDEGVRLFARGFSSTLVCRVNAPLPAMRSKPDGGDGIPWRPWKHRAVRFRGYGPLCCTSPGLEFRQKPGHQGIARFRDNAEQRPHASAHRLHLRDQRLRQKIF
jgi:hypothetical protein